MLMMTTTVVDTPKNNGLHFYTAHFDYPVAGEWLSYLSN
jgi:hypothetical protein